MVGKIQRDIRISRQLAGSHCPVGFNPGINLGLVLAGDFSVGRG